MAHKKGVGSTDNGRDSKSKRLGVKLFGGEHALAGNILVRQRGTKYHPGLNVYMGRDHTLHAAIEGTVVFKRAQNDRVFVNVQPIVAEPPVKPLPRPKPRPGGVEATPDKPKAPKSAAAPVAVEETPVAAVEETPVVAVEETPVAAVEETPVAAVEETPAAPVEKKAAAPKKEKGPKPDDLKIVEGIGPKIETLLKEGGIANWDELAAAPVDRLKEILDAAGPRYQIHDPSTWPAQARFAAEGKWEELKEYQEMLIGGRDAND